MSLIEQRSAFRINDSICFMVKKTSESDGYTAVTLIDSSCEHSPEADKIFPNLPATIELTVVNISASGMAFNSEEAFANDTTVLLTIRLTKNAPILRVIGNVVHTSEVGTAHFIRVHFNHINEATKAALEEFTANALLKK
ncbi:MAG: hypothetical protein COB66_07670 [Coxiella sp. (in: Bacteria)]|nr:MAG: hypothetical protein COB66_07670 [Coxiella sp. (in: g-proteobacteria)]